MRIIKQCSIFVLSVTSGAPMAHKVTKKIAKTQIKHKMRTTVKRRSAAAMVALIAKRAYRSERIAEKCLAGCMLFLVVAASAENLTLTMAACALMAAAAKHLEHVERNKK